MNTITKYTLNGKECYSVESDNVVEDCNVWFEKSKSKWWIRLPKDHKSGRQYIAKALVDEKGLYVFDDKTSGPRVLNTSWRAKLTGEEITELTNAEETIERLKKVGQERARNTTRKDLENELETLRAQLRALKGEEK